MSLKERILDSIDREIESLKRESSMTHMGREYYDRLDNKICEAEDIRDIIEGIEEEESD